MVHQLDTDYNQVSFLRHVVKYNLPVGTAEKILR